MKRYRPCWGSFLLDLLPLILQVSLARASLSSSGPDPAPEHTISAGQQSSTHCRSSRAQDHLRESRKRALSDPSTPFLAERRHRAGEGVSILSLPSPKRSRTSPCPTAGKGRTHETKAHRSVSLRSQRLVPSWGDRESDAEAQETACEGSPRQQYSECPPSPLGFVAPTAIPARAWGTYGAHMSCNGRMPEHPAVSPCERGIPVEIASVARVVLG